MVTYLNNYKEAKPQGTESKSLASNKTTADVLVFTSSCNKKAQARANLLKAAQKIRW
ncbi:hypothetical protein [Photobacterium damselae]|uniref:hypothetical protein n=1 Tax=Photobacterium damselae TaxID=38293 RepID=UPI0015E787DE|nr:hypothetical protein [Photobacterium damselae]UKA31833.1 hypothetical protein IPQ37_20680 [Photobacterium damselae subsp. damselae]